MKKILSVLMALIMALSAVQCLSVVSFAADESETAVAEDHGEVVKSGNCGPYNNETYDYNSNVTYTLYEDGQLVIGGSGAMADFYWNSEFPDTPYASYYFDEDDNVTDTTVKSVVIEDGVTHIGKNAFSGFAKLESAVIPDSVETIGELAFANSAIKEINALKNVRFIDSNAFVNCNGISAIIIDNPECELNQCGFPPLTEIHGYKYTPAYDYAVENGNPFVEIGEWKTLDSIGISSMPNKTTYKQGSSFRQTGLSVMAYFTDGTAIEKTKGFTVSGFDSSEIGTCTLTVTYEDKTTTFDVEIIEFVEPTINAGETINVEVEGGSLTFIKFVPTVTGTFTCTSVSYEDTYGYLYQADKETFIMGDDDGGMDANFSMTYDLEAGNTYYWAVRYYNTDQSGSFDVRLTCDQIACAHENKTEHDEQPATCTEDGYTAGVQCNDCGKWLSGHELIKKHHTDADGDRICDNCGEEAKAVVKSGNCGTSIYNECDDIVGNEDNAQFVLYDDGELVISGSGSLGGFGYGMDDELPSVPYASYSRWYDEEEDWDTYFDDTVKSVIIEDGITAIGKNAFYRFRSLESVVIPDSVKTIDYNAFAYSAIKEVNLPASVYSVGSSAFWNCNSLSKITVNHPECDIFNSNIPSGTEIHGYKYSTAYDCVLENGNSFVQIGEWKTLDSIGISSMPYKTTYKQGSSFSQDGLIVTLRFTDGTSVDKTRGFTVSDFDSSEIGTCTLTVTYEDKTAEFDVEIKENKEYVINSGETIQVDVESDIMTYIKFVPTIDGTFTFTLYDEGEMPYAHLFDAEKNTLVYGYDSESITYNFETGKTYYWGVRCYAVGFYPIDVNLTCDKVICAHENTTNHPEQPATCTADGYTAGVQCNNCEKWLSGHELVLRHHTDEDDDRICDICGKEAKVIVKNGNCGASIYDEWHENIEGNEDNAQFVLYDDGELVISGTGSLGSFGYGMSGEWPCVPYASYSYWYDEEEDWDTYFDDTVKSVIIEDGITAIGDHAFYRFRSLESVSIPDSVETINYYAFANSGIKEINLPASVQSVGSSVFSGCSNLSTITVNNPECDIFNSNIPYETEIHGYKYSTAYDCVLENGNSFVQIGEAKELENISISSMPYKTIFKQDTSFRQDGLAVTLNFTDGTSVDKTRGFTVSGFDSSEIGSCTLTVTYEDKTATFDVEIIENKEYVINSGETIQVDVESDSMTYIKFVPTIDGTFTFTLYDEGEMPYAYLFDAEKNTLVYGYDSEPITYNFETGKTYYWGVSCCAVGCYPIDVNLTCDKVFCAHENTTNHPEQPATCTENGYTAGTYCEDCGRWISGHKKIVKHHVDEDGDGICDVCKDEFKTVIEQGNCGAPIYDEDDEIVGYEDVNYDLYDNGLLVISGEGQMRDFDYYDSAPYVDYLYDYNIDIFYDNTVKAVVIENGVTSVGDYAFSGFRSLSSVTIPESVTRIGDNAFSGCTALENINIPDSVRSIGVGALTKEISFEPATAYAFHEGVSDGYYNTDDDGESYYYYSHPDFENGDKLTVLNIDGTETEYTLKDGYFEAENADRIDAGDLWFRSNQYQNHWLPDGENNYLTIRFGAAFCTVPVAVYGNPVESISVTLTSPYVLMDRISSDETVHFRTGDVLTVNYTGGTSKEFVCKVDKYNDYTFTSSDGEKLNGVRINRDGDFSVGMNAATVNYAGKTCDFPVEVTQCTVESISASYRYTLYNGYDCQLDTCEEHDEWCSSEEYINDAYVLYSVNLTDGNVFTGTETEVYEKFGARPWTHIVLDRIGTNEGSVTLGDFIGTFTVNVEEKPSDEENLPTCYFNSFNLNFAVGQKVDYQLIQFADKGYTHSVNVISVPDGLTLSQDGRLTGTVTSESGWYSLEFDVRWNDTYVHEHYGNPIKILDASSVVEIPEVDDLMGYDTRIYVEASASNPTWLKFRACYRGFWISSIANDSYDRSYDYTVYTENGVPVSADGYGDGDGAGAGYDFNVGEYYYIKVYFSGWIKLNSPRWLPVWGEDDNLGGKMNYSLVETNVEKEFDGDSNTLWNVYKLEMPFHVDTNGGITYDIFGAMARFASPVNIHITSEATSNLEILNKKSYKFDPNSVEECEAIGASTEQDTLVDKLLPGEKEYRFDTVYYLMPEVADFDLVQTSLLYVPVGYALTDDDGIGRITESCTHGNTETITENEVPATCKEGGSYDSVTYCKDCGVELSRETVTTPKKAHTESAWITDKASDCVNGGTKHTECTVCGEILQTAEIPANGHSYESVVTAPTCTADGYTTHTCKVCGERYTDTIVDKLGHSFTSYVSNGDATCTADGTKTAKCERCDATDTVADTGSKKAHTKTSIPAVSATCTEKGLTEGKKCSDCGEILVAQKEIPANGHSYESVVTAPTCTADGYTTHTCKVCGDTYTDSVVKAKGHTEKTAVTKATTSKNGKIVTTCAVCGESLGTTVIYKASSIKLSATKYTYDGKTKTPTVTVKDSKGNTLKKGTDYTVKYATGRKNTGKYTVTVTFNGNYTGSKTLSFNILPGKTSKLTATQTTSSVKATWKSVTGASGYKVTLYSAKNKAIKTVYTTKTSASFTKLSKGTTYKVKVTAYKTIDGKKVTSSVSTLLTTATKPGTPTLKATAGTKKATLSWNKQTGATGYVVYMATSKNGKYSKIATVKGGSKVSFTKTGLTKGKTYYFKVAAFETVGGKTIYGGYSAVKSVKVK